MSERDKGILDGLSDAPQFAVAEVCAPHDQLLALDLGDKASRGKGEDNE